MVERRLEGPPPETELESKFLDIVHRARLPEPRRQFPVETRRGPKRIDCAYPEHRLAIELDGFGPRVADRKKFDTERVRQADIEALGWRFLRFTSTHLDDDQSWVAFATAEAIGKEPDGWRDKPSAKRSRRR
jgi:very-short-patch-repair endonuclease